MVYTTAEKWVGYKVLTFSMVKSTEEVTLNGQLGSEACVEKIGHWEACL